MIAVALRVGERARFYSGTVIAAPFWEGQVGLGKLLLELASTVILGSETHGTHDHVLPSHNSGSCVTLLTHFGWEGVRECDL
jgi:hypothetical protein